MVFILIDIVEFNLGFVYEVVKSVSLWELVLLMTDIGFQLLKRIKLMINVFGPINPIKMKLKNVCIKIASQMPSITAIQIVRPHSLFRLHNQSANGFGFWFSISLCIMYCPSLSKESMMAEFSYLSSTSSSNWILRFWTSTHNPIAISVIKRAYIFSMVLFDFIC